MKVLFVVNPKSGTNNGNYLDAKLLNLAGKHGFNPKIIHTEGRNDDKKIRSAINEFQPETVVAVGGDGTVNLLASHLIERNVVLGIIPTGSANGLAYNLNIPNNVEKAFLKLVAPTPKPLDVILLNDKYHCLHLSDTGINARIVQRFEKEGSKGQAGYAKQLFKELFSVKTTFRAHVKMTKVRKSIKAEMMVIANAKSFGTGAQINPLGEPDDGKFEIVVIRPYPWWFIFRLGLSFFTGKLYKLENVKTFSTNKATITFKKPQDLQIDGEIIGGITSLKVAIIPGALKVFY